MQINLQKGRIEKHYTIPHIGNFSHEEILAKMSLGRCDKFSLSSIFAIIRILNEDVSIGFIFPCVYFWRFQGGDKLSVN